MVHNTPVQIYNIDMVFSQSHDMYNLAQSSIVHHKSVTYNHGDQVA
jgi:hypothetical protein